MPRASSVGRQRPRPRDAGGKGGKRARSKSPARRPPRRSQGPDPDDFDAEDDRALADGVVPADLSRKIMRHARAQQEELETEALDEAQALSRGRGDAGAEDEDEDDDYDEEEAEGWEDEVAAVHLDAGDEALLDRLMPSDAAERRTLADVIMGKLGEHRAAAAAGDAGDAPEAPDAGGLPPRVVEAYTSVGDLLKRYRAGKLPKAFKIVPRLNNWEDVLFLTQPQHWSPQACGAATRLFASALGERMAQRFYALVLLPAVLDDVDANGKLNYHYYMALKKAAYKPAAFFKGIVLPMCEQRCALQPAAIVCSVMQKVSLPAVHVAACLYKLAGMPLSGASILFMRTLVMKKHALPYKTLDALADYLCGFTTVDGPMPVIWHQTVLVLAQHYKTELTRAQKDRLKALLRAHTHPKITPEIRRELFTSICRGEPRIAEVEMMDA